jgi:hypothetical protein
MSVQDSGSKYPEPLQTDHVVPRLLRKVWQRLNEDNEHFMFCVVGQEGSGKSHTAYKICDSVDTDFGAENVFFRPEEFLKVLKNEEYEPGDMFMLDEAGVGLGKRTWAEKQQKKLNQALQLIRDHNIGMVFTLPRLQELDSQAKGRLQGVLEIVQKKPDEFVVANWWTKSEDRMDMTGKTWWDKVKLDGRRVQCVRVGPPDSDLSAYQSKKDEFQREVYEAAIAEGEEEDAEEVAVADIAEKIKDAGSVAPYMSHHGGHNKWVLSKEKLRDSFNLTHRDAKRLKDHLREDPGVDLQGAADEREENTQTNTTQGGHS